MKRLAWLVCVPAVAHNVSLSTGELTLEGIIDRYRLLMPAYELQHIREPERTVLGAIELAGARLAERHCLPESGAYLCEGEFVFAAEPAACKACELNESGKRLVNARDGLVFNSRVAKDALKARASV